MSIHRASCVQKMICHPMAIVALLTTVLIYSCGNGDSSPEELYIIETKSKCTENLKDILDENIHRELDCIQESLNSYTEGVKREKPNYIQRKELDNFLKIFFPENYDLAENLLKLIFDFNTLLFDEPEDHLSIDNIPNLFALVHYINDHGRYLKELFNELEGSSYWTKRQQIYSEVQQLSEKFLNRIKLSNDKSKGSRRLLNTLSTIDYIKSALDIDDDQLDLNFISSTLFIKTLLFGGDRHTVNINELGHLLHRVPNLLILVMDAIYSQDKDFINQEEEYFFYYDLVNEFESYIWPEKESAYLFNEQDIATVLQKTLKESYNKKSIQDSLANLKAKVLTTSPNYTFADIYRLLDYAKQGTGLTYFSSVTFAYYKNKLLSSRPIKTLSLPSIPQYSIFDKKDIRKYWSLFKSVATGYRYFSNDDGKISFSPDYKRSSSGFTQLLFFKWGIGKLIDIYGHAHPKEKGLTIGKNELHQVMQDAKGILQEFIYWPDDYEGFLSETITNSDLFQYQSNGNDLANKDELAEYLATVLHSFDLSDRVHDLIKKQCAVTSEDQESFNIHCFREHFYPTFFEKINNRPLYGKLYDYKKTNGQQELRQYFKNIESYARVTNDDSLPITPEEITRLIVIISSLEGIYIKYDTNRNNRLERPELDRAFVLFKGLIRDVAQLKNPDSKLYHSIFLYIIKKMREPSPLQVMWFHLFGQKKNITSTRFNISAALSAFLQ